MSEHNPTNLPRHLAKAVGILKACVPLADLLVAKGITIELNDKQKAQLLDFEQLTQSDFSESDWSYLRVVSGVKVKEVAALTSCLARFRAGGEQVPIYGKL